MKSYNLKSQQEILRWPTPGIFKLSQGKKLKWSYEVLKGLESAEIYIFFPWKLKEALCFSVPYIE